MLNLTSRTRPLGALLSLGLATAFALSACGSEPAASEPSREAANLSTRVCISNKTTLLASVAFDTKDTAQEGQLVSGGRLCGEGTVVAGNDVAGTVSWAKPAWQTIFFGTNPWMGNPNMYIRELSPNTESRCAGQGLNVNESISGDNGIVRTTITRLADDQWKEFEIVFTPSTAPSTDGLLKSGAGFGSCGDGFKKVM